MRMGRVPPNHEKEDRNFFMAAQKKISHSNYWTRNFNKAAVVTLSCRVDTKKIV